MVEVERELTAMIHGPSGADQNAPGFGASRQRVLDALRDKPLEVDRKVPELDSLAIHATRPVEEGMITSVLQGGDASEEGRILACLRSADLPAWILLPP